MSGIFLDHGKLSGRGWPVWWLLVVALWALAITVAGADEGPLRLAQLGPRTNPVDLTRYQRVVYVHNDPTEAALGGAGTRQDPWNSVMHAMDMIRDAGPSQRYAVLVARGVYPARRLALKPYVNLYGGFNPDDWTRDIRHNVTTLDGGGVAQVLLGSDNAVFDGFTVIHGASDSPGAALVCQGVAPIITNNIFTASWTRAPAAGGVGQTAPGVAGGGVACLAGAAPELAHNIISFCSTNAGQGAGIVCDGGSAPHILGNIIVGNVSGLNTPASGAGAQAGLSNGGGIACLGGSSPRIVDNVIANNVAGGKSDGGGIFCAAGAALVISENIIAGNLCERNGGGVAVTGKADPQLRSNYIASNDAAEKGGGVYLEAGGSSWMVNNIIAGNNADTGGAVGCFGATMQLMNDTLCDNSAVQGGAIYCTTATTPTRPPAIVNSILWGNQGVPVIAHPGDGPPPRVSYCDVQGGYAGTGNIAADPLLLANGFANTVSTMALDPARSQTRLNVVFDRRVTSGSLPGRVIRVGAKQSVISDARANLLLVWGDLTGGTNRAPTRYGILPTYHLQAGSPCIDAGTPRGAPRRDIDGDRRPRDRVDIGADEHPWAAAQGVVQGVVKPGGP